jgi:RNA:NAD 2'-phosphotransferase (TPT1/KptA family)
MIFYHGTSKENWEQIQKEGILFGKRNAPSRCTYLAVDIDEARQYGDILLEVEYDPSIHPTENNYISDCWQIRVYEPIPIEQIKIIR